MADHLVILIHGIRTNSAWGHLASEVIRKGCPDIKVEETSYGYFEISSFLWGPSRKRAVQKVRDHVLMLQRRHGKISVIAHSFGTYIVNKLLEHPEIHFHRIIFCGAVVPLGFNAAKFQGQLECLPILNECGRIDIWPLLAGLATKVYGPSGTVGLPGFGVHSRVHHYSHSAYFTGRRIRRFWIPFLRDGTIINSAYERLLSRRGTTKTYPVWVRILQQSLTRRLLHGSIIFGLLFVAWEIKSQFGISLTDDELDVYEDSELAIKLREYDSWIAARWGQYDIDKKFSESTWVPPHWDSGKYTSDMVLLVRSPTERGKWWLVLDCYREKERVNGVKEDNNEVNYAAALTELKRELKTDGKLELLNRRLDSATLRTEAMSLPELAETYGIVRWRDSAGQKQEMRR